MRPLVQSITAGIVIALLHSIILQKGWTLWDVNIVSVSSLGAGIFFILGMIFNSTLQDYKNADKAIATLRGNLLSVQDLNLIARAIQPGYDPFPFHASLSKATTALYRYVRNAATYAETDQAVTALIPASHALRSALPGAQANLFLNQHAEVRQALSYLGFLRHHYFPKVGYVFLWFFATFIIVLQLFSQTQNPLLDTLFIFSFSSILVFFIAFIRDLDYPFLCHLACFTLDTRPLEYVVQMLNSRKPEPVREERWEPALQFMHARSAQTAACH